MTKNKKKPAKAKANSPSYQATATSREVIADAQRLQSGPRRPVQQEAAAKGSVDLDKTKVPRKQLPDSRTAKTSSRPADENTQQTQSAQPGSLPVGDGRTPLAEVDPKVGILENQHGSGELDDDDKQKSNPKRFLSTEESQRACLLQKLNESKPLEIESIANEVLPQIDSLSTEAVTFILSMLGGMETPAATNLRIDLAHFVPMFTSLRLATMAAQPGSNVNQESQFSVRYFAGNGENKGQGTSQSKNLDMVVSKMIETFFCDSFKKPEREEIRKCTTCAHSIFVTVRKPLEEKGDHRRTAKKGASIAASPEPELEALKKESIICCLNFALLGTNGFFVNWLATSGAAVTEVQAGKDFLLVHGGGDWKRRGLGLFLMKATNLAVMTKLRLSDQFNAEHYCILLQARMTNEEVGHLFYKAVGFEEAGTIESMAEMDHEAFPGCAQIVRDAPHSKVDYIHLICDDPNILLFRNRTGTFGKITSLASRCSKIVKFRELASPSAVKEFSFPFAFRRNLFLILAKNLDAFFLPFQQGAKMDDFIEANTVYTNNQTVVMSEKDRKTVTHNKGWLNDAAIDFMIRWYVLVINVIQEYPNNHF